MQVSKPSGRPIKWVDRCGDVKIAYVAFAAIVCVISSIIWFVISMLPQVIASDYQISATLFMLGAISGLGALGMSYVAQAQERTGVAARQRSEAPSARVVVTVLLAGAYLAMTVALINLWI